MATKRTTIDELIRQRNETSENATSERPVQEAPTAEEPEADLSGAKGGTTGPVEPSTGSWWDKAKGYAKQASEVTKNRASKTSRSVKGAARKVQTRSAAHDAQTAAAKVESVSMETTATLVGLTKTLVAGTVGSTQGLISGMAKATRPVYVKILHAADENGRALAKVGEWTGFKEYTDSNHQTHKVMEVDVPEQVKKLYGIENGNIEVTGGTTTYIQLDGRRTKIIASPIRDRDTGELIGVFIFNVDKDSPTYPEILVYENGFEELTL